VTAEIAGTARVAAHGLPREFVQGSQWLSYEHMFRGNDPDAWLFRTPDFRVGENGPVQSGRHLDDLVQRVPRRDGSARLLLVGEPDIGKTTIAYALMCRLPWWSPPHSIGPALISPRRGPLAGSRRSNPVSRADRRPAMVVPLARYLREYQEWPSYFGTRLWMRSSGPTARTSVRGPEPWLILDSLDDLARHDVISVEALLGRDLFTQAAVITCSRGLFERIKVTGLVGDADVVILEGLGVPQRLEFARRYMEMASLRNEGQKSTPGQPRPLAQEVAAAIRRDAAGEKTFREPLHLLIQLEILRTGDGPRAPQLDFYVTSTLEQEVATGVRTLPLVQISDLLGELATLLNPFEAGPLPVSPSGMDFLSASMQAQFVRTAADRLQMTPDEVVRELSHCRFTRAGPRGLGMPGNQFRDYFVARDVMRHLLAEAPWSSVGERFANLFPGAIVGLLMDELRSAQRSEVLRTRVLRRLLTALDEASRELGLMRASVPLFTPAEMIRHRVICQQLSFYLAVAIGAGGEEQRLWHELVTKSALRGDHWIRRGVTVGLGLGGRKGVIAEYVERLWDERHQHDRDCCSGGRCASGPNRQVNVEFNLVLFGDASPRNGTPDRCDPPGHCEKTISGMLDLLETETNLELCQLVLFIILDLYWYHWFEDPSINLRTQWRAALSRRPRDAAPPELSEIAETDIRWTCRDRLEDVLARFETEPWEEIGALRQLLDDISEDDHSPLPPAVAALTEEGDRC
jgi:hypothetical protein